MKQNKIKLLTYGICFKDVFRGVPMRTFTSGRDRDPNKACPRPMADRFQVFWHMSAYISSGMFASCNKGWESLFCQFKKYIHLSYITVKIYINTYIYIDKCKYNDVHINILYINKYIYIHKWSCQNIVTVDSIKVKHEEPIEKKHDYYYFPAVQRFRHVTK